ncbi:transposable element Tcb1 transposase [Trichonephila clavipes]|nr:transposable element Tcb1 transposase [Trichonephila clavipes]
MTSRKRMEDSELWRAVGRIEAGQSITDVALFYGVHHSVISRLWKQLAISTHVKSMVTASIGKAISAATVGRRLHMNGLYAQVPRVCVHLSVQSRGPDDKRIRIWRKQGTRNQPQNITEHHAFRGGSIMVLAGISLGYRTDLHIFKRGSVTADQYRDEVLEPIVRLYAAAAGPIFVLMDDNARPHRADIVHDYLESVGIARMA